MTFCLRNLLLALIAASLLGGCITSNSMRAGPAYHISDIQVADALAKQPETRLTTSIKRHAVAALADYPRTGDPKILKITLTELHHKSAAKIALTGDDYNYLKGYATVIDKATGRDEGSFYVDVGPNGPVQIQFLPWEVDALRTLVADKSKTEVKLSESFARWAVKGGYHAKLKPTEKVRKRLLRKRNMLL